MKQGWISWKQPLLAAAAGLALGLGARWISHREPAGGEGAAEMARRHSPGRTRPGAAVRIRVTPAARFIASLAMADAARCGELFREMTADGVPPEPLELEALFARWMEVAKPLDIAAELKAGGLGERTWTTPFFEAWAANDYAGAMAESAGTGDFAAIRALVAIRRGDPAFLAENFDIWDPENSRTAEALADLGRNDPELAKGVANRRGTKPDQNVELIAAVVRGWAGRDPAAALEWVQSLGLAGDKRGKALDAVFSSWLKRDADAAAKAAGELETTPAGLSSGDAIAILRHPESVSARVFLANRSNPFARAGDLYQQLSAANLDWGASTVPTTVVDSDGWFATDPARDAAEAAKLPPGKARDFLLATICAQWADRSPAEARAFAETQGMKPPYVRIDPPAHELGANPPETLAPLFDGQEPTNPTHERLKILAEKWAQADPRAAADWLVSQPDSVTFDRDSDPAMNMLLQNSLGFYWAKIDAKGASRWAGSLPDGARRNAAWRAMSFYVANYSPDLAFTTSAKLVGDDRRMETLAADLQRVAENIGFPAAREALETVYLTADERAELAGSLTKPAPAAR